MSFKLSLDDVEPWKTGGVILGPGTHPIKVVEEEIEYKGEGEEKHPVVKLQLVAIGGEEEGGEIRDWVHVTPNSLGRVAQIYEAFEVEVPGGEFEWIPLLNRTAKAIVRRVPRRDGKTGDNGQVLNVSEVKGYAALTEEDKAIEGLKETFGATEVKKTGGVEDDIPF